MYCCSLFSKEVNFDKLNVKAPQLIIMTKFFFSFLFCILLPSLSFSQMWNGVDTLYGNEWIDYDQRYFKFLTAEDGIFKIDYSTLKNAGFPIDDIEAEMFQLFSMGVEVPIRVSTSGILGNSDFLIFEGKKNKSELDNYLFENPSIDNLNPEFSLFTDSTAFFLTWSENASSLRFAEIPNETNQVSVFENELVFDTTIVFSSTFRNPRNTRSTFSSGEGWALPRGAANQVISFDLPNFINDSEDDFLSIRLSANAVDTHQLTIKVNDVLLLDTTYIDDSQLLATVHELPIKVPGGILSQENNIEIITSQGADLQFVSNLKARYKRSSNVVNNNNLFFKTLESSFYSGLSFEFDVNNPAPICYDLSNSIFINPDINNDIVSFAIPPNSAERQFVLSNSANKINNLKEVNFRDLRNDDGSYIILTSYEAFDNPQLAEENIDKYRTYRSSEAGGNFDVDKYLIDEIYNQFSYGIHRHPISIRNFAHFKNKIAPPEYLLIIGKGREYHRKRTETFLLRDLPFIPTFGVPGADNMLVSTQGRPLSNINIGRLATTFATDIENYLNKVIEHESFDPQINTIENREWTKKAMHFGGGTSPFQQLAIKLHLEDLEEKIETNGIGATVKDYYKDSSDPIEVSQSTDIINRVNDGVSLMTVFGHGSIGSFDFAIDLVDNYSNKGKYPLLISMGCYSGNIHDVNGTGYDYVFTKDKGSIGFMAMSGQGAVTPLYNQVDKIYDEFGKSGDLTIGKSLRNSFIKIDSIRNDSNSLGFNISQQIELLEQYTLLGDPAVKFHNYEAPDYSIIKESISLSTNILNAEVDDIELGVSILNLGRNLPNTSILVEVYLTSPSGIESLAASESVDVSTYQTAVNFKLPVEVTDDNIGWNRLRIVIDADDQIDELPAVAAENNNEYSSNDFGFYVVDNSIVPVYPTECSIVNESALELISSSTSVSTDSKNIVFQVDKSSNFNTTNLSEDIIETSSGIANLTPSITPNIDEVYYWRTSLDSTESDFGYDWQNSSFLYHPNLPNGFNQSHYQQFNKNRFANLEIDDNTKNLKFIDDIKEIRVKNFAFLSGRNVPAYFINNTRTQKSIGNGRGFYVAVLDSITVEPWVNPPGGAMGAGGFNFDMYAFPFRTDVKATRGRLINFLKDSIPDNNYVLMFTSQTPTAGYSPSKWLSDSTSFGTTIFDVLEAEGATKVRALDSLGSVPYVFFYKKGQSVIGEFVADSVMQVIDETFPIVGNWTNGFMASKLIGPSQNWDSLVWKATPSIPNTDEYFVNVIGRKVDGNDSLIFENITNTDVSLSTISAERFPYLSLEFHAQDTANRTSPNLDYWRVFYEGYPEVAINTEKKYVEAKDTLGQGEIYTLELGYENLSQYDMDSLLVYYTIKDGQTVILEEYDRIAPLTKRDASSYKIEIDTKDLEGTQSLFFEINPNKDQPELHEFNNFIQEEFFVKSDQRNPLLDVTFDGLRIMNGEIVSSKPIIVANLKDENLLFPISDSASFEVSLRRPDEVDFVLIPIASPEITFIPANTTNNNIAKIEYKPTFTIDGEYELKIKAKDASGNSAGRFDYVIKFNVITKSSISNLLTYPNPFSTSTSFVYTLTGSTSPANYKIQIMTISGKIVREITDTEMGPLRIGTHKTDFQWNGTDEFGDKLANGVYLYRFVVQNDNGEAIEQRATSIDEYFKNDIGKLVILR